MNRAKTRLLFLCAGNSCRSQMAEGLARAEGHEGVEVVSAGTTPKGVHPLAVRVMAEVGIDISRQTSKALADLPDLGFDVVITLCDHAAESCPILPGNPEPLHWGLSDPAAVTGSEEGVLAAFRETRDELRRLVDDLFDRGYLAALAHGKRQADMILDNISDAILAHDLGRRVFYFNAAAERITGYRREDVLNRLCQDVFPGGLCDGKCSFCEGAQPPADDPFTKELDIATRSGERRHVTMTCRYMNDAGGERRGVLVSFRDLTRETQLARRLGEIEQFSGLIGRDPKMLALYDLVPDLAESLAPVLIQGESGTGKELLAAALHNEGPRAGKLFVPVNCGALPEGLLESELFGHVRGAFTGAIRDKKGRFELADGGTIFLDEIGDISPAMQVKLLRVLQEGSFERVGGEKTIKTDVRVISATNKNLAKELVAGRFREDLFYRLSVVPLTIPPLRDRRTDIPLLGRHFLQRAAQQAGRAEMSFSDEAMDFMLSYHWPGNVRELQNWIQFALIKCKGTVIRLEHLPPMILQTIEGAANGASPDPQRQRLTAESVRDALQRTRGNKVEAAKVLGVSRATLYRFLDGPEGSPQK
jgi:sigma-54 dependent transcriptional regulator, acetoin dehydrogenase operon transcriptional activator AcoR